MDGVDYCWGWSVEIKLVLEIGTDLSSEVK
jgi:hypothetical protein